MDWINLMGAKRVPFNAPSLWMSNADSVVHGQWAANQLPDLRPGGTGPRFTGSVIQIAVAGL